MSGFLGSKIYSKHALSHISRALLLLGATHVMAQEASSSSDNATPIQSVVVSSGRLQQQAFDAPASIYRISEQDVAQSGLQLNLSDTLGEVPGVMAVARGSNYAQDSMISIRGFGAHVAVGFGGVRLISDGIPAMTPDGQGQSTAVNLSSVDRIEVLKGPLGQLYGNASGGVIQTFTREAGDQPELIEKMATGSYGLRRTDTLMSGRVGNTGIVADYNTLSSQGYRDNSNALREQFNTVVTTQLQEDSRLKVILNSFKNSAGDPAGLTAQQLAANPAQAGNNTLIDGSHKTTDQTQIGFVFDHRFDADLHMSARYYDGVRSNMQDLAKSVSTYSPVALNSTSAGTWTGLNRTYGGLGISVDGKRRLNTDMSMDWIAGIDKDYANENRQQGTTSFGAPTSAALSRNELDQSYSRNYYAQANWHFSDQYTLVTGVRNSEVTLLSTSYITSYTAGQVNYSATTPVMGLTWHARDDLNLYYNNGQGFETPTLLQAAYTTVQNGQPSYFNTGLKANTSHQQEVGAKWTPSVASQINADVFQITSNNEIVAYQSNNGKTSYTNAGGTLRQGMELAWREQWNSQWRSVVNLTAMQATYQSSFSTAGLVLPNSTTVNSNIAAGNQLAGLPTRQLYASLQWSQNGYVKMGQSPIKGLQADVEWVARSHMWADDANTAYVAGYGIFNAQVRENFDFQGINWQAFAMVNNLGNQNYVGSVIVNQTNGQYFEPGLPRNWVVGMQGQLKF